MSKCIDIDELVNGISTIRLDTLIHAAEISPFVTERTIGPDLPKNCGETNNQCTSDREVSETITTPSKNVSPRERSPKLENKTTHKASPKTEVSKDKQNTSSDRFPASFSSFQHLDCQAINNSILLREAEHQRRRSVRQKVIELQDKYKIVEQNIAEKKHHIKQEHDAWLAEKRRCEAYIIAEAEKQALCAHQESEQEMCALRQETQRNLQLICFQGITQYHNKFRAKFDNIVRLIMSIEKQELLACEEYNWRLKELIPQFDNLIGRIKDGACEAAELRDAEKTCKSLDSLEESIITALENIVHQEEQRSIESQNQELERKQQEELQQQQQNQESDVISPVPLPESGVAFMQAEAGASQSAESMSVTMLTSEQAPQALDVQSNPTEAAAMAQYVSAERFDFYTNINSFYQGKVEKVKPLQTDENMKKYRFACQKAINIPVNAISAVNPQHLRDKFEKLFNFISGQPIKAADGEMVSINDHPLGRDYCILLMAKKFVSQGDTAVSSNPQAAFPLATVIVSLWKLVPDFGPIFLAYIFKDSPFLVPYFIPQRRGQDNEDYYKVLGYRVTNGQLEQQDMYLKRQAGIARLYAAVMVTNGRQADGTQHPYGVEAAWRWLSNFVSLAPLPDICATIIMEVLQIVGADMWSAFGKQFLKLLLYLQHQYFPELSAVDEGGPKTRLQLLLGSFLRDGQIPRPQGMLPAGFW